MEIIANRNKTTNRVVKLILVADTGVDEATLSQIVDVFNGKGTLLFHSEDGRTRQIGRRKDDQSPDTN